MGKKAEPSIRWTQLMIGTEFGLDRRAVKSRLIAAGITPGEDNKYGSRDVKGLFLSDREMEKLREVTERADHMALKNRRLRGELIPADIVLKGHENLFSAIREVVRSSGLTPEQKNEIFRNLRGLTIEELARVAEEEEHDPEDQ